jgi:hypothetical protein
LPFSLAQYRVINVHRGFHFGKCIWYNAGGQVSCSSISKRVLGNSESIFQEMADFSRFLYSWPAIPN